MSLQLAVNTSEKRGQFLFINDNEIIDDISWETGNSHSEVLTTCFQDALKKHSLKTSQFEKIFCVIGPGSFTGLRVGVSFCKTVSYLHGTPIYPVNSLDLLALNCKKSDRLIVSLIDAQKNSVFCSTYKKRDDDLIVVSSNEIVPIKEINKHIKVEFNLCGQGLDKYKNFISSEFHSLSKVQKNWEKMELVNLIDSPNFKNSLLSLDWKLVQPLYIKASAPEEKLKIERN